MAWTNSTVEPEILDPRKLAREIIAQAIANMKAVRQQEMEEAEADERELERLRLSAAARKTWATRKANKAAQMARQCVDSL